MNFPDKKGVCGKAHSENHPPPPYPTSPLLGWRHFLLGGLWDSRPGRGEECSLGRNKMMVTLSCRARNVLVPSYLPAVLATLNQGRGRWRSISTSFSSRDKILWCFILRGWSFRPSARTDFALCQVLAGRSEKFYLFLRKRTSSPSCSTSSLRISGFKAIWMHLFLKKKKKKDRDQIQTDTQWEFPGGPVVRTQHFHCNGPGFDPWLGN